MRVIDRIVILFVTCLGIFHENGHCCEPPAKLANGFYHISKTIHGEFEQIIYGCNSGFNLVVEDTARRINNCRNGTWTNLHQPSCVRNPACGVPGAPDKGTYIINEANTNVASYECDETHVLVGPSIRTCSGDESGSYWTPLEIPRCFTNLPYLPLRTKIHTLTEARVMADGEDTTCGVAFKSPLYIALDLAEVVPFTNIVIKFKNGSKVAVELKAVNFSSEVVQTPLHLTTFVRDNNVANRPLSYDALISPKGFVGPQMARYIYMEDIAFQANNTFSICEIQIFNSLESTGCGTPDTPSDGVALRLSHMAIFPVRYGYLCNNGYTRVGPSESQCSTGEWTGLGTKCRANTKSISSTTTLITPISEKEAKGESRRSTDIAIGFIAAAVVIVLAILIAICVKKKFYEKNTSAHVTRRQKENEELSQEKIRPISEAASEHHYEAVVYDDVGQRPFLPLPRSTLYYEAPIVRPKSGEYLEIMEDTAPQRATHHVAPHTVNIKTVNRENQNIYKIV